jgi:two-component system, cell cycle response regulator
MTARILVVDDIPANVKLLEAKLSAEYFDVLTAQDGISALSTAEREQPDIILLDVMMPGLDGFETCRRLKQSRETAHIPVVMVTALDQSSDRVKGLDAGADDFLTKPVDDVALFARVKSLVRLKRLTDELRLRQATGEQMGLLAAPVQPEIDSNPQGSILLVEDRDQIAQRLSEALRSRHQVFVEPNLDQALMLARAGSYDLFIVSLSLKGQDGLRLCSQLRSTEQTRNTPVLALVEESETPRILRALEMGVNDYLVRPIDRNELVARVRTQLKRKLYTEKLRQNLDMSVEFAVTDQLTGLYNRRYMASHIGTLIANAADSGRELSLLILDIDYFKSINDTHGHDVGDQILREFAKRIVSNVRSVDLACRYGGEEFVVIMPDTDLSFAYMVAERVRQQVASQSFVIDRAPGEVHVTISIGVTTSEGKGDTPEALLRRADQALYRAKRDGRNRVVSAAA